nr:class F sortase [Kitasatospora sp. SID7827]
MVAVAIALAGAATAFATAGAPAPPPPPPASAGAPALPAGAGAPALARAVPTRLRIPALGVDAGLLPLALGPDGSLRPPPPERGDSAGWYAAGTSPGERGTAVVAGHVDTPAGPAVFFLLSRLAPGASVTVDRAGGGSAVFTVDRVVNYPKSGVPDEVYAPASRPELRLITCGGSFDRSRGGYQDNTVVYAHLTGG